MPRGDIVLAKASGGEPIVRRVWVEEGGKIAVAHEDYYKRWQQQRVEPWTFAIDKADVFKHDDRLFQALEAAYKQKRKGDAAGDGQLTKLWSQAKPYGQ
ncbi:MAG: S24 family peptidase [Dehalococcoidia bacterium]|nr:S24 family peptidase [Dehalococcoidia bacterium]